MVESLEGEVWMPVVGYEELYSVSNLGRVKRNARSWRSGRKGCRFKHLDESLVAQRMNAYGYKICTLCKDGVKKTKRVHVLVAMAFIENSMDKPVVNHKDGNKAHNEVSNLEWMTTKENCIHSITVLHKKAGERKYTGEEISQMEQMYADGMRPFEIANTLNIPWPDAYAHSKFIADKRERKQKEQQNKLEQDGQIHRLSKTDLLS